MIGQVLKIQEELYQVVRTLKVKPGILIPVEDINTIKQAWHAEKAYKHGDIYYFVNEITTIEPIEEPKTIEKT